MRWILLLSLAVFVATGTPSIAGSSYPATSQEIPATWTSPIFVPSFDFPSSATPENLPWAKKGFQTSEEAEAFMLAVRSYVYEGMNLDTWDVGANSVRKWYHVPWMHVGPKGREFVHGLTKERSSYANSLGPLQKECKQNWAVGFYNPAGGTILGQIWGNGSNPPNFKSVQFPEGTVVAKLLFTEADATDLSLLAGAPEWQANIYTGSKKGSDGCLLEDPSKNAFEVRPLRLFQFDIAVRDSDANDTTGWIFGTFMYDGTDPNPNPWMRVKPVGLMWGNDPNLSDEDAKAGQKPKESIILDKFGFTRLFGRGGRMNGPVDNPSSACLSCHMTAQSPEVAKLTPRGQDTDWKDVACWFRNLTPDTAFGRMPPNCGDLPTNSIGLDFSLQLSASIDNYKRAHPKSTGPFAVPFTTPAIVDQELIYPITRDGF